MLDLNGKWIGELIYDESFGQIAHEVLFFVVELTGQGDEFRGVSVDVDGVGMVPVEADISGFTDNNCIYFMKEYKPFEQSNIKTGLFPLNSKKSCGCSFSGTFNEATKEIEGEWISFNEFIAFNNNIPGPFRGGTWRMRKES
jgi:hypothetical protein